MQELALGGGEGGPGRVVREGTARPRLVLVAVDGARVAHPVVAVKARRGGARPGRGEAAWERSRLRPTNGSVQPLPNARGERQLYVESHQWTNQLSLHGVGRERGRLTATS